MATNQRLAPETVRTVLKQIGNGKCFDCNKAFVLSSEVWANVAYGTLLCTKCAGVHATMPPKGVIKSLVMDFFTPRQELALRIGSNSQLKGFFQRQHIEHTKPDLLYQLRPSAFYRQQIAVELFRRLSAPLPRGQILTDSDILKLQQLLSINGNMKPSPGTGDGEFMVKLENLESNLRPLGLTLTETHGGRALVHRVTADGLAQSSGIRPGDYVVGVGSDREWRYQVVLSKIAEWAAPPLTQGAIRAAAGVGKAPVSKMQAKKKATRTLKLAIWRPQWRPDAFIVQTVQSSSGLVNEVFGDGKLARTSALLEANEESKSMAYGGSGSQDWKSFMARKDEDEHQYEPEETVETAVGFSGIPLADGSLAVDPDQPGAFPTQPAQDDQEQNILESDGGSDIVIHVAKESDDSKAADVCLERANGWIAQAPNDGHIGKRSMDTASELSSVSQKPAWIAKVGGFFAHLDPNKRAAANEIAGKGATDDEDDDDDDDDDEEEDNDEDEGETSADPAAIEAEAEQRVRALLFSHLAVKRSDTDSVKMDAFPESDSGFAAHSSEPTQDGPRDVVACKVVVFAEEHLGMVLNKGRKGEAVVASLLPRSPAARAGIVGGDVVVGVNAMRSSDFNQVLWLLRNSERPMHILLVAQP